MQRMNPMNDLASRTISPPESNQIDEGQVSEMWICVHEQVFNGKSRKLADTIGCSQDEAVGLLIRLWVWGLTNCNRQGLVEYGDTETIAEVLVQGLSKSFDPKDIVGALIECGYLDVDDDSIYIHDWEDWQRYWYSYKDRRDSDKESKKKQRAKPAEPEGPKPPKPPSPKPAASEKYSPDFEELWSVYPRTKKTSKVGAYEKYNARKKDGFTAEQMLQAVNAYAAECKRKHTEERYILHAETFLGYKLRFKEYLKDVIPEEPKPTAVPDWTNPFEKRGGSK